MPAILALCYRAWSHKSLTPVGIAAAALTAIAHAIHPWNLPFVLLVVFYLAGDRVTKIKADAKANLTVHSTGSPGGDGPRTHVQVLANSCVATVLILLHAYQLHIREKQGNPSRCYPWGGDLLVVGIIANYAAVAADTFSSELGILSSSQPRLITSKTLRKVPRGTNGGVTVWGLLAGLLGSIVIVTASLMFLPFCSTFSSSLGGWSAAERQYFAYAMVFWGALGSVVDSFLGGWLQQSVIDTHTGRIVEGDGGKKVLVSKEGPNSMHYKQRANLKAKLLAGDGKDAVAKPVADDKKLLKANIEDNLNDRMGGTDQHDPKRKSGSSTTGEKPSRIVESGLGLLDNNEVNVLMALTMSLGAMVIAGWAWDVPLRSIIPI